MRYHWGLRMSLNNGTWISNCSTYKNVVMATRCARLLFFIIFAKRVSPESFSKALSLESYHQHSQADIFREWKLGVLTRAIWAKFSQSFRCCDFGWLRSFHMTTPQQGLKNNNKCCAISTFSLSTSPFVSRSWATEKERKSSMSSNMKSVGKVFSFSGKSFFIRSVSVTP